MKAKTRNKKFDTVKMMREIRDKLSEKYLANPEIEEVDSLAIRKKYGIKIRGKVHA